MTCQQILDELEQMGDPAIKRIFMNHGAPEPLFGVRIGDLKKIQKKLKKNHELSLQLYNTGNADARYLAGLIADETKMTKKDLAQWMQEANYHSLCEFTIPWVAAESRHGYELALEWIESERELTSAAGWSTLASLVTIKGDEDLDLDHLQQLLNRVVHQIHTAPNRTRYAMNNFIIAVGCAVTPLSAAAKAAGETIGTVKVNMGATACKVPAAPVYIQQTIDKGKLGHKKKTARC